MSPSRWPMSPSHGKRSKRFCGSSRNCGRSHHQRQHETFDSHAFKSNRQKECVRMPRKTARSGSQTPLGRSEMSRAIHPLASRLPASSENAYHPRQFRVHLGNPESMLFSPIPRWRIANFGYMAFASSSAEFGKFIAEDIEKWAKVVKFAGIRPD